MKVFIEGFQSYMKYDCPYKNLGLATILRSVRDIFGIIEIDKATKGKAQQLRKEALEWMFDVHEAEYSFDNLCDALELDANTIRAFVIRHRDNKKMRIKLLRSK